VARGGEVALFVSEPRDIPLSLRITGSVSARLDKALESEKQDPRNRSLTKTELGARLVELGANVYSALDSIGGDQARVVANLSGDDQMKMLEEVLRRGFASMAADKKPEPTKRGK
jgi:hypothetical protein